MKRSDIKTLFPDASEDQIQKLMDMNGSDINEAKRGIDEVKAQLTAARAELDGAKKAAAAQANADELQKAQERAATLENELSALKLSNQLRDMRAAVAKSSGVPVELLTGDSEEACKAQAEGILAFAKPSGYPALRDGGEAGKSSSGLATRDMFAAWVENNF